MEQPQPRKNICSSRSFGHPLTEISDLEEALSNYAITAVQRMRDQGTLAQGIQVFLGTNTFKNAPQYNSISSSLPEPTDDRFTIVSTAKTSTNLSIWKTGLLLLDLVPRHMRQGELFTQSNTGARSSIERWMN